MRFIPALIGPVFGPLVGGICGLSFLALDFSHQYSRLACWVLCAVLRICRISSPIFIDFDLKGFLILQVLHFSCLCTGNVRKRKGDKPTLLVFIFGFLMLYFYYKHARKAEHPIFPAESFSGAHIPCRFSGNLATRLGISSITSFAIDDFR
jgi:MFS family permease